MVFVAFCCVGDVWAVLGRVGYFGMCFMCGMFRMCVCVAYLGCVEYLRYVA